MNIHIIEKMKEVAKQKGILLHLIEEEPTRKIYTPNPNTSARIGHDEIIIGEFEEDKEEIALIAFFREVGHCMIPKTFVNDSNYSSLMEELEACNVGIREAMKNQVLFSDKAIEWLYMEALQYVGRDEQTYKSWNTTNKPKLFVNQVKNI
jgi:hypothetical protein